MKRVFLVLTAACFIAAAGFAQEPPAPDDNPNAAPAQAERRNADRIRRLESQLHDLRDAAAADMDNVHARLDDANRHLNRMLLIFAAAGLLIVLLVGHNLRLRQRLSNERVERAVREAESAARDLRRHLSAPASFWKLTTRVRIGV